MVAGGEDEATTTVRQSALTRVRRRQPLLLSAAAIRVLPARGRGAGAVVGGGRHALGRDGEVDAGAARDLFAGKHPHSGEYLIPARGSSARANARSAESDLDTAAAAALLGLSVEGVRARLRAGTLAGDKTPQGHRRIPASAIEAHLAGRPAPASPVSRSLERIHPTKRARAAPR